MHDPSDAFRDVAESSFETLLLKNQKEWKMTLERGDWVGKWQICFRENSENVRPKVVGNKRFWCRRHGKYTHRTDHAYGIIRTATYFQSDR
ncbi:hypothetical protein V1477_009097 [Vespula maculifrons]|uniref:Uncharacterized protein n=1 Tax=Vespula maculifrons TaxID=7453 RepID=A0ABD2CEX2_VESMC